MRKLAKRKQQKEPTIALINIVFLMLVFFMVAGTLAQPLDTTLSLVQTRELDGRSPPDALVIHADGKLQFRGNEIALEKFLSSLPEDERKVIRVVPDRDLEANNLITIARQLRSAGAERIMVITQRGLQ